MAERSRPHGRDASRGNRAMEGPHPGSARDPARTRGTWRPAYRLSGPRHPVQRRPPPAGRQQHIVLRRGRLSSPCFEPASKRPQPPSTTPTAPVLELDELTILTAWAEGVSEAAAYAPERIDQLLAAARPGATWRAELGLPEPSPRLADAIVSLGRIARAAPLPAGGSLFDALLATANHDHPSETDLDQVVRRDVAIDARGAADQATNRSQWHTLSSRRRGHRMSHSGRVRVGLAGPPKLVDRAGLRAGPSTPVVRRPEGVGPRTTSGRALSRLRLCAALLSSG